jgi:hypothetical protein
MISQLAGVRSDVVAPDWKYLALCFEATLVMAAIRMPILRARDEG